MVKSNKIAKVKSALSRARSIGRTLQDTIQTTIHNYSDAFTFNIKQNPLEDEMSFQPRFHLSRSLYRSSFQYEPPQKIKHHKKEQLHITQFRDLTWENIQENLPKIVHHLEEELEGRINLSFIDIKGSNPTIGVNAERLGWSASTIKIPVMIGIMREIDEHTLKLNHKFAVDHAYPLESYDPVTCMSIGSTITVRELLRYMIVNSDNEATNMLADFMGLQKLNEYIHQLGAPKTMLAHLLTPRVPRLTTSWNPDGSNLTTAHDLAHLVSLVYKGQAGSHRSCVFMRSLLESAGASGPLSSALPRRTRVGSKLGYITDFQDGSDTLEAGVINGDYALAIMCNRVKPADSGQKMDSQNTTPYKAAWNKLTGLLDEFHLNNDLPFYFRLEAQPTTYQNTSSNSVIMTLSRVFYNLYYGRAPEDLTL